MLVDRFELLGAGTITCPLPKCDHIWCKDCQQTIDTTGIHHSCDGSAELDQLLQTQGWRRCPGNMFLVLCMNRRETISLTHAF